MLAFGRALPRLRRVAHTDLSADDHLSRSQVLGVAIRLLDVGLFRIGSYEHNEEDTGLGLATVRREHVRLTEDTALFDYPAKSGVRRSIEIRDPESFAVVAALRRRRSGPEELLAYRSGRRWQHLHADDINQYIKAGLDDRFSAKDFRTWNATVLAATSLAGHASRVDGAPPASAKRVFNAVSKEVAESLGNTPAVARRSYIDPRLFDLYEAGHVADLPSGPKSHGRSDLSAAGDRLRRRVELAVLALLS